MELRVSENTWDRVLGKIESKVSPHSFGTWFRPTSFLTEDASSISVRVPNSWFAEWPTRSERREPIPSTRSSFFI